MDADGYAAFMANNDINILSVVSTGIDSWLAVVEYSLVRPADKKKIWPKMVVEVCGAEDACGPGVVGWAISRKAVQSVRYVRDAVEKASDVQTKMDILSAALKDC